MTWYEDYDPYEDESWINGYVRIPLELRRPMNDSAGTLTRWNMAHTLASELMVRADDPPGPVMRLMEALLPLLAEAVLTHPEIPGFDDRGMKIGPKAVAAFTIDECLAIAGYFNWAKLRLKDVQLRHLNARVHEALGRMLGEKINATLVRWGKRGWVGIGGE